MGGDGETRGTHRENEEDVGLDRLGLSHLKQEEEEEPAHGSGHCLPGRKHSAVRVGESYACRRRASRRSKFGKFGLGTVLDLSVVLEIPTVQKVSLLKWEKESDLAGQREGQ